MLDDVQSLQQPIQLPRIDPHLFPNLRPSEFPFRQSVLEQPEAVFVFVVDLDRPLVLRAENENGVDDLGRREIEGDQLLDLVYSEPHAGRAGIKMYLVDGAEPDHKTLSKMARACSKDVVTLIPLISTTTTEWSNLEKWCDFLPICS